MIISNITLHGIIVIFLMRAILNEYQYHKNYNEFIYFEITSCHLYGKNEYS